MNPYENKNHLIQQRAWFLYALLMLYVIGMTLSTAALVVTSALNWNSFRSNMIAIILSIIGLFLVRAKKYYIAANIILLGTILNVTMGMYFASSIQIIFVTWLYNIGAILLFAGLFCERKAMVLLAAWFSAVVVACSVSAGHAVSPEMQVMIKKGSASVLTSIVLMTILP
jgi:phosphoglycerol transferase MdoB-like AlkP superfamily enzyme